MAHSAGIELALRLILIAVALLQHQDKVKRERLETKPEAQICQVSHAHYTTTRNKMKLRECDKTQIATKFGL